MSIRIRPEDALAYHRQGRPGKIEVTPTKPIGSQRDLSLAYSPGVAEPCREIHRDPETVGLYTARSNLVGVVTNGTAVLGLGNIGPLAAKPVMEGKAVLFKRYADIDVFDLEVAETDPAKFIEVVAALEPTFGGINLEDIRAPDCFIIERALRERMSIPVFHDDQHGTAIITAAALLNAAEIQGKALSDLQVVCIGAGAAALASMNLWVELGVKAVNVCLVDIDGVVTVGREPPVNEFQAPFANSADDPRTTLDQALVGADVMIGLAAANLVNEAMIKTMAERPIILALANPDPEIPYDVARRVRPDAIIGTGRSDFPNQVNNVLGFPYIFRGALDVGAKTVNQEMKLAAVRALAELAKEGVTDDVMSAYGGEKLKFGPEYIIPKPMDERGLYWVAPAVAKAAIETGVARRSLDIEEYQHELMRKLSPTRKVMWSVTALAQKHPRRVVFPEGDEDRILQAAQIIVDTGIAEPILIGDEKRISARSEALGVTLEGVTVISTHDLPHLDRYADVYWQARKRRGLTRAQAERNLTSSSTHYGMMMVRTGDADGLVSGLTASYKETIRPALQIVGVREGVRRAAGVYLVITKTGVTFLADTTINIDPDAETLAEIAILAAELATQLGIEPRVAMLSFSNFGDAPGPESVRVAKATKLVKERRPSLMVEGEIQADLALLPELRAAYPFSRLKGRANVLIFPNLSAGNIAYKLLAATGGGEVIGPLVLGMQRPVNVLQQGASVNNIVHMTAITVARAHQMERAGLKPAIC